ncbi:LVIVD repeat-containing protein [Algoriphagus yeomjeoni]|uniref:LVIVD repeat-containing protein n=1 Tax=Algoriphagus yeomjeoni TaxID=291403 RepID=UPI003CE5553D
MKSLYSSAIFLLSVLVFTSCQDEMTSTYTYRTMMPVYYEMSDIRARVITTEPAKPLDNPGKIYIYEDYLFINEPTKGIHILNNENPANPVNLSFIPIAGNVDLAVNGNILYADNYVDLLAFDISNISNIQLIKRIEDVFTHMYYHQTGEIITFKDTVLTSENPNWRGDGFWLMNSSMSFSANYSAASQSYGTGGSMARFTLSNGHLYAVDESTLRVFDVKTAADPTFVKPIDLGWGIETIFPFQDKLFIGSNVGMHIYDASTPNSPTRMAVYEHVRACDPVVVNEDFAFVTLRNGTACNGVDELHVIDINDLYNPTLKKSYPMLNPHGLGLAGNFLYIAEGAHGLKSFNASDVMNIDQNQLEFLTDQRSVDLIPGPKSLIVIGPDGVCQFDYSNPAKLKKLSCIQVTNPTKFY